MTALAPPAPGRIGEPLAPEAAFAYLEALGRWRDERRRELDQLDQAALAAPPGSITDPGGLTADIALSLALWKAVADRYELLRTIWDSGRVGAAERTRMASLIWGRLDATIDPSVLARSQAVPSTGLAVSLPEACRLSDALAGQLRVRLSLGGAALDVAERLRQLRATLERIRDQVDLEPAGSGQQAAAATSAGLARRLREISDKAARGGDVGGLVEPLDIEATTFERDLIVNAARRREAAALRQRAVARRADAERRTGALRDLVDRCIAAVDKAPKYAVPDVAQLGDVPDVEEALTAYLKRLEQVTKAIAVAETAYQRALDAREELIGRLDGYRAKANSYGVADDPELTRAYALAREALDHRPTRMGIAEQLVTLYQSYLALQTGPAPARQETR